MKRIGYYLFRIGTFPLMFSPFFLIYWWSSITAFLLRVVIRYRRSVVVDNINRSFPDKSEKWRNQLSKSYYSHLSDIIFENLKLFFHDNPYFQKRVQIVNPELINKYYDEGKGMILTSAHIGNWEWATAVAANKVKPLLRGVYKPLKNEHFDQFLRKTRKRHNYELIRMRNTGFVFRDHKDEATLVGMLADQNPANPKTAKWHTFLNQDTCFLAGPEAYAKKYDQIVLFANVQRTKRGHYSVTFELICDNAKETGESEITQRYVSHLEKAIHQNPVAWLWSHRRWKHSKPTSD